MSGLNYKKLGSTLSNICNTTQLDDVTKCHYAFKNFWGEPCAHIIDFTKLTFLTLYNLDLYEIQITSRSLQGSKGPGLDFVCIGNQLDI